MTDDRFTDDDVLLRMLGTALDEAYPVPDHVTETAVAAFEVRDLDAGLAELVADTATAPAAGVRGGATLRRLTFRAGTVDVEIGVAGEPARLSGRVVPAAAVPVELQSRSAATAATTSDEAGRFRFEYVPSGPLRVRVLLDTGPVATDWVVIAPS